MIHMNKKICFSRVVQQKMLGLMAEQYDLPAHSIPVFYGDTAKQG